MTGATKESKVSEDLSNEIDEGIDNMIADIKEEYGDPTQKDKKIVDDVDDKDIPSEKDLSGDDAEELDLSSEKGEETGDDTDDDDKNSITDELLDRASAVGMGASKAKSFQTAAILESVCEMLEAQGKPDKGSDITKPDVVADPLESIPDIELDPEIEYDEAVIGLVGSVKALKELVIKQQNEMKNLRDDGKKNAINGFFDSKVLGLSDEFTSALKDDPKKHEALRKQHEVLVAGYAATGEEVSGDAVFDQAVSVVLGDVKTTITEKRLSARKKQQINRPSGAKDKAAGDPIEEVADDLDRKYFGKK